MPSCLGCGKEIASTKEACPHCGWAAGGASLKSFMFKSEPGSNLTNCADCGAEISREATACPKCGKPTKVGANKENAKRQGAGCFFMLVGLVMLIVFWPVGLVILFLSGIYTLGNTRLW